MATGYRSQDVNLKETADRFFDDLYRAIEPDRTTIEMMRNCKRMAEISSSEWDWPGNLVDDFSTLIEHCQRNGYNGICEKFFRGILGFYRGRGFVEMDCINP